MKNAIQSVVEMPQSIDLPVQLTRWYDRARRDLPWRYAPGTVADPYKVWLSEIMLQQTTVKSVTSYFDKFITKWPTVEKLASASLEDVLKNWAGLGYYSRARNLHKCALQIVSEFDGRFPSEEMELLKLPGIGPYTAAAIAAIAFDVPATVVDGNVERVISRLFAVKTPLPQAKPEIKRLAETLTPQLRPGDYAQAMMDLGATVCSQKRPSCMFCPIKSYCWAYEQGIQGQLPNRTPKGERPLRCGAAFFTLREDGCVLLRARPREGLLGGMMEIPSSDWLDIPPSPDELSQIAPVHGDWWLVPGQVHHTFTHFKLEILVYRAVVPPDTTLNLWARSDQCRWVHKSELKEQALPSVMRKIIAHAADFN